MPPMVLTFLGLVGSILLGLAVRKAILMYGQGSRIARKDMRWLEDVRLDGHELVEAWSYVGVCEERFRKRLEHAPAAYAEAARAMLVYSAKLRDAHPTTRESVAGALSIAPAPKPVEEPTPAPDSGPREINRTLPSMTWIAGQIVPMQRSSAQ